MVNQDKNWVKKDLSQEKIEFCGGTKTYFHGISGVNKHVTNDGD
jgi:hypothetical protein